MKWPVTLVVLSLPMVAACTPIGFAGSVASGAYAVAEERSLGAIADDASIKAQITHHFLQKDMNDLLSNVDAEVKEGRVLLTGSVMKDETMLDAVRIVWGIPGVREVMNEVTVTGSNYSMARRSEDAWITTQAKSRLIAEKNVRSINYAVETVNGVAYVMGIAQDEAELARATNVVSRIRGVKRVVSYVRMKESVYRQGLESNP